MLIWQPYFARFCSVWKKGDQFTSNGYELLPSTCMPLRSSALDLRMSKVWTHLQALVSCLITYVCSMHFIIVFYMICSVEKWAVVCSYWRESTQYDHAEWISSRLTFIFSSYTRNSNSWQFSSQFTSVLVTASLPASFPGSFDETLWKRLAIGVRLGSGILDTCN